jgi:sarcosine oxidase subunit beta
MANPTVVVVGGGALGLATAVNLTRKGVTDVTVLEADHVASGSSGLSVGIIETQYLNRLDIALRVRAMEFFAELERDHGLDIVRNGYLRLVHDDASLDAAAESVAIQHELGVDDAAVIDREHVEKLVPHMRCDDVLGGLWGPSDGFIDGHLYANMLAEIAMDAGARVAVRQPVTAIEANGSGYKVRTEAGEELGADYVVNAAGAWGPRIAELAGLEMPLVAQRHQAAMVKANGIDYTVPSVMDYIPHSGEIGVYFRHERPGQLIAGLHSEDITGGVVDPDSYARSADPEFIELLAEKLADRLPSFEEEAGLGNGWAGLYPVSPDGKPQLGPNPGAERFITVGGAGGSGIQLSPVLGELAAEWIVDGEPSAVAGVEALLPGRASLNGKHG